MITFNPMTGKKAAGILMIAAALGVIVYVVFQSGVLNSGIVMLGAFALFGVLLFVADVRALFRLGKEPKREDELYEKNKEALEEVTKDNPTLR